MSLTIKLTRYKNNPILAPLSNSSWECQNVSNAGAAVYDGKIYLLYRAEGKEPRTTAPDSWPVTRLGLAVSDNGFDISCRHSQPFFDRDICDPWREYGCEDPRITKIEDTYYIVYVAMSRFGHFGDRLVYVTTKDFKKFSEEKFIMKHIEQRTSGFLPEKINDEFVLFHRIMPNMWVSTSKDLVSWNIGKCILETKENTWYENKLGIGAPPLKTEYGWLLFWHGKNNAGKYALGIMLLDINDPTKIIKFQEEPILTCETEYEKHGFVDNVVYTNGAVRFNGKYFVYYGCCDRCLSVATIDESLINEWCSER